jgi:hypothetical protein
LESTRDSTPWDANETVLEEDANIPREAFPKNEKEGALTLP